MTAQSLQVTGSRFVRKYSGRQRDLSFLAEVVHAAHLPNLSGKIIPSVGAAEENSWLKLYGKLPLVKRKCWWIYNFFFFCLKHLYCILQLRSSQDSLLNNKKPGCFCPQAYKLKKTQCRKGRGGEVGRGGEEGDLASVLW